MAASDRFDVGLFREERGRVFEEWSRRAEASTEEVNATPYWERYAFREAAYGPGTVVAVPTVEGWGANSGMFGLIVIESCNWLGTISWFGLDCWVDELPTADTLDEVVASASVVEAWITGDAMTRTGDQIIVGQLSGFDVADWPIPVMMWIDETRGPSVVRLRPREFLPCVVESPEVAGFLTGQVPQPWIETRHRAPNFFPNLRMSDLQHVRTPVAEFSVFDARFPPLAGGSFDKDSFKEERIRVRHGLGKRAKASGAELMPKPPAEQYALSKAAYRAGTVVAVPALEAWGASPGMFGLMVIESCNWLGNVSFFGLDCWVDELPTADTLDEVVASASVVEAWHTGGAMIWSGDMIIVGELSGFDVADWPTPVMMWTNETRGPSVVRIQARKNMPAVIESPEVAGFVTGQVPEPWIEIHDGTLNFYPNLRMSDLQHVRTPAAEFNVYH